MFDSGTKVVVLASSHRGPTGVKKGSVGFFHQLIENGRVVRDREQKVYAVPAQVIFTRYGFEKKSRCEKKKVMLLLPEVDSNYSDVSGQVAKLSRRIQSGKNELWNRARKLCGEVGDKTPAVMMVPAGIDERTIDNMQSIEVCAWMEAILTNDKMIHWLMAATQDRYINRSFHPELTEDVVYFLREVATDKSARMNVATAPYEHRKPTLTSIRLADMVCQRAEISSVVEFFQILMHNDQQLCILEGPGKVRKSAVTACFYNLLFRPHYITKIKHTMLTEYGDQIEKFFREPEAVKGCLLVLSACLERTGKIDGKKAMSVGQ